MFDQLCFADRKPPGVGRGRGRGREDGPGGRQPKGIGRGLDDGGAKGMGGGRGRGGSGGKAGGSRGKLFYEKYILLSDFYSCYMERKCACDGFYPIRYGQNNGRLQVFVVT